MLLCFCLIISKRYSRTVIERTFKEGCYLCVPLLCEMCQWNEGRDWEELCMIQDTIKPDLRNSSGGLPSLISTSPCISACPPTSAVSLVHAAERRRPLLEHSILAWGWGHTEQTWLPFLKSCPKRGDEGHSPLYFYCTTPLRSELKHPWFFVCLKVAWRNTHNINLEQERILKFPQPYPVCHSGWGN